MTTQAAPSSGIAKAEGGKKKWSDMADDEVTAAVATESTVPDDEDSDGMGTMRSDSTRLSNSRSHASRASGRKQRDKAKYLAA